MVKTDSRDIDWWWQNMTHIRPHTKLPSSVIRTQLTVHHGLFQHPKWQFHVYSTKHCTYADDGLYIFFVCYIKWSFPARKGRGVAGLPQWSGPRTGGHLCGCSWIRHPGGQARGQLWPAQQHWGVCSPYRAYWAHREQGSGHCFLPKRQGHVTIQESGQSALWCESLCIHFVHVSQHKTLHVYVSHTVHVKSLYCIVTTHMNQSHSNR